VYGLELIDSELLRDPPNLKVDVVRGREIDLDRVDIEPKQELSDLNPLQLVDAAVLDDAGDVGVVVDEVLEVDVAGGLELDLEAAVPGEGEGPDSIGEKARREAEHGEELVDCRSVRRRRVGGGGEEGEREEEEREEHSLLLFAYWRLERKREYDFSEGGSLQRVGEC